MPEVAAAQAAVAREPLVRLAVEAPVALVLDRLHSEAREARVPNGIQRMVLAVVAAARLEMTVPPAILLALAVFTVEAVEVLAVFPLHHLDMALKVSLS
jgi:hypothetical protein